MTMQAIKALGGWMIKNRKTGNIDSKTVYPNKEECDEQLLGLGRIAFDMLKKTQPETPESAREDRYKQRTFDKYESIEVMVFPVDILSQMGEVRRFETEEEADKAIEGFQESVKDKEASKITKNPNE